MSETVAAVVVTFNRCELLCECIAALMAQRRALDMLYVIDNASTDRTHELLSERGYLANPKITYTRLPTNIGGAGGFNEGMKRAFEDGHEWIWVMDDDAEAPPNLCETLLRKAASYDAKIICPLIVRKDGTVQNYHHKLLRRGFIRLQEISAIPETDTVDQLGQSAVTLDANAFVGPLFHRDVIQSIGLPKSEFFIWGDDTEYTYRASTNGFMIILATEATIFHKDKATFISGMLSPGLYWKMHHRVKNKIYFLRHYVGLHSAFLYAARVGLSILSPKTNLSLYKVKVRGVIAGFKIQ